MPLISVSYHSLKDFLHHIFVFHRGMGEALSPVGSDRPPPPFRKPGRSIYISKPVTACEKTINTQQLMDYEEDYRIATDDIRRRQLNKQQLMAYEEENFTTLQKRVKN